MSRVTTTTTVRSYRDIIDGWSGRPVSEHARPARDFSSRQGDLGDRLQFLTEQDCKENTGGRASDRSFHPIDDDGDRSHVSIAVTVVAIVAYAEGSSDLSEPVLRLIEYHAVSDGVSMHVHACLTLSFACHTGSRVESTTLLCHLPSRTREGGVAYPPPSPPPRSRAV